MMTRPDRERERSEMGPRGRGSAIKYSLWCRKGVKHRHAGPLRKRFKRRWHKVQRAVGKVQSNGEK